MATFPKLSTNVVAQYPSVRRVQAGTQVMRFVDGSEQRFRTVRGPRRQWLLRLHLMNEVESEAWLAFFNETRGSLESFTFVDPWDGVEYADCSLDMESMEMRMDEHGCGSTSVIVRRNQV